MSTNKPKFNAVSMRHQQDTVDNSEVLQRSSPRANKSASRRGSSNARTRNFIPFEIPSSSYTFSIDQNRKFLDFDQSQPPPKSRPSDWSLGEVIVVPHIELSTSWAAPTSDYKIWTNKVGYAGTKIRPAIIVGIFTTHMVVLPVFSCGGSGLTNKSDQYKLTAISVYNKAQEDDEAFMSLLKLTREKLRVDGDYTFNPGSHVNLLSPFYVHYQSHKKKVDTLNPASNELLLKRYRQVVIMSVSKEPHEFKSWLDAKIRGDEEKETAKSASALEPEPEPEEWPELPRSTPVPSSAAKFPSAPLAASTSLAPTDAMRDLSVTSATQTEINTTAPRQPKGKKKFNAGKFARN